MKSFFLTTTMILFAFSANAKDFGEMSCRDLAAWKGSPAFFVSWIHGMNERVEGIPPFKDLHDDFAFRDLNRDAADVERLCAMSPDMQLWRVVDIMYPDLSDDDKSFLPAQ